MGPREMWLTADQRQNHAGDRLPRVCDTAFRESDSRHMKISSRYAKLCVAGLQLPLNAKEIDARSPGQRLRRL